MLEEHDMSDSVERDGARARHEKRDGLCVAVVGATGAVGEVLLTVLAERALPVRELRPLASERSAGATVPWQGRRLSVLPATPEVFEGVDVVFFAATGALSRTLAPAAVAHGAVVIDKSNTWRMDPRVPLVVPEINPEALDVHQGIVSCPNCTTIGVAMALAPLERIARLRDVVVTTLQAASGAGREGVEVLERERRGETAAASPFAAPLHDNVVPLCETFAPDGDATEEHKLRAELRKILSRPDLPVSVTCVRVPVAVGHASTLLVETEPPLDPVAARAALEAAPGVEVVDDPATRAMPTPQSIVGRDVVGVGRIRREQDGERLWLWQVGDNLRKGAATNAVQIAETLLARKLLG
jgi:aspartate-semialdehyde dehydrogenase